MLTCPACGFAEVQLVGPSYYECQHIFRNLVPDPMSGRPIPTAMRCGNLFQTPANSVNSLPLCFCRVFFAVDTCVDCGRPVCRNHQQSRGESCVCGQCVNRVDATTAYGLIQPFYLAIQVLVNTADPVERLVRWYCMTHVDEYLRSGSGLETWFEALFPDDARPGLVYPFINTQRMSAWFVHRAYERGLQPTPCYRRRKTRSSLLGGGVKDIPPLDAWRFPGGAMNLESRPPAREDAYLLVDGRVVLQHHYLVGVRPAELTREALAGMATSLCLQNLPVITQEPWATLVPPPPHNPWGPVKPLFKPDGY